MLRIFVQSIFTCGLLGVGLVSNASADDRELLKGARKDIDQARKALRQGQVRPACLIGPGMAKVDLDKYRQSLAEAKPALEAARLKLDQTDKKAPMFESVKKQYEEYERHFKLTSQHGAVLEIAADLQTKQVQKKTVTKQDFDKMIATAKKNDVWADWEGTMRECHATLVEQRISRIAELLWSDGYHRILCQSGDISEGVVEEAKQQATAVDVLLNPALPLDSGLETKTKLWLKRAREAHSYFLINKFYTDLLDDNYKKASAEQLVKLSALIEEHSKKLGYSLTQAHPIGYGPSWSQLQEQAARNGQTKASEVAREKGKEPDIVVVNQTARALCDVRYHLKDETNWKPLSKKLGPNDKVDLHLSTQGEIYLAASDCGSREWYVYQTISGNRDVALYLKNSSEKEAIKKIEVPEWYEHKSMPLEDPKSAADQLPKRGLRDKALEADFVKGSQGAKWREKFEVAIIESTEWAINRNELTGVILGRSMAVYVGARWPDGHCTFQDFTMMQAYDGSRYSGTPYIHGIGGQYRLQSCETLNLAK